MGKYMLCADNIYMKKATSGPTLMVLKVRKKILREQKKQLEILVAILI